MSKRAEEKAIAYADKKLQVVDPELWETSYTRYRKMSLQVMSGGDVEEAYQDGYEQAEKDILSLIKSRLSELHGDAQPTPILRYELLDLVKKIKED